MYGGKPRGKKAEPTREELEFIYERIPKLSDSEILDDMQDESFPLRTTGFIKRRRKEFDAARTVLEEHVRTIQDPLLIKAQEEHYVSIRGSIEYLREYVCAPDEGVTYDSIIDNHHQSLMFEWEYRMFPCLEQHIPDKDFWEEYNKLGCDCENAEEAISSLERKIIDTIGNMGSSPVKLGKGIKLVEDYVELLKKGAIFRLIKHDNETNELKPDFPAYMKREASGMVLRSDGNQLLGSRYMLPFTDERFKREQQVVLVCDSTKSLQVLQSFTTFLQGIDKSDEFKQFPNLEDFKKKSRELWERLSDILESREYMSHTCHLCPGQQK